MPIITSEESSKKGPQRGLGLKNPRTPEVQYREALFRLNRLIKQQTASINQFVRRGATPTQSQRAMSIALRDANMAYDRAAAKITPEVLANMSEINRQRIERSFSLALGVDTSEILDTDEIRDVFEKAVAENVGLIRTIPSEHFARVNRAITQNYNGESFDEGSLTNRLAKIGSISDRKAKFIARDQTAKFIGSLNEVRQKDAGINAYRWRNVGDIRVTGAPGGPNKPSRSHGDHWKRDGKIFTWDKPPSDGHPGQPIGCRCFAEPVIEPDKVNKAAVIAGGVLAAGALAAGGILVARNVVARQAIRRLATPNLVDFQKLNPKSLAEIRLTPIEIQEFISSANISNDFRRILREVA